VDAVLGVSLSKGESYTEWCRRPLTDAQRNYAADDVRYLLAIADGLRAELERRDRTAWAEEEMRSLADPSSYDDNVDEVWRKVTGRGTLSARQTAVLRELAGWREQEARSRDLPRGWIVKDPTLIEIARRSPEAPGALKSIRGLNPKEADRSARAILDAIDRGKSRPAVSAPPAPPRTAQARARMLSGIADAIVRARCEAADVATELVATRGDLEALLVDVVTGSLNEGDHRLLTGWRRDLAGEAVLALARGEIAVKAIPTPPYIEEVHL
jgi:ribonuclease D